MVTAKELIDRNEPVYVASLQWRVPQKCDQFLVMVKRHQNPNGRGYVTTTSVLLHTYGIEVPAEDVFLTYDEALAQLRLKSFERARALRQQADDIEKELSDTTTPTTA
jgi:hypothetical protein